ncbi:protocadherin Fat 3-like [Ostrinia nubilalis]|uniref:protocadherin Fat 3-like n=1 Tax=Ostrinia nubilalis TaxID=29057 RepID=UPI0030822764
MGVERFFAAVLLVSLASAALANQRCSYIIAIPRPETPVLPPIDYEGKSWSEQPLIPGPTREEVCMENFLPDQMIQVIYMEEEIEGDVIIAKLNYQGSTTPVLSIMSGQPRAQLGPEFRQDEADGQWSLVITQRQDYETATMQSYVFSIQVEGESQSVLVALEIVNIDDNPPILQVVSACVIPEHGEARLTDCVYQVSDRDGEISTRFMTFRVDSSRAADESIFYMVGEYDPSDWFNMKMTVGINSPLNFETTQLHIFSVTASDSLPNNHTVTMMVQVENVESRPPRWVEIFSVQQFDEKTNQSFSLRAIDGDTGINRAINYTLIRDDADDFFSLEVIEDGAILHVTEIDRDTLERELFNLTIVAYKSTDANFATEAHIFIIVNDVNDQRPEPLHKEYSIDIMEETPMTLNFNEEFGFHDRDLGENAQYTVELEDVFPPGAASAFYIAPGSGYQRQTFIMGTINHTMLDYEDVVFQNIIIKIKAVDMNNASHVGEALVYVNLINWNDELPIFEESSYSASFKETVGAGFPVATVLALDRDIDDVVVHSLMGNAVDYLFIDESTGEIFVSMDDAFDYHRQNTLFVQVRADDTLGDGPHNTVTTQLVIELEDVNNTPPTLRLPRSTPSVEENVPEGYEISREITATDPDTSAYLWFEIDWDSTWATKQGRETNPTEYVGCIVIETIYPTEGNRGSAIGRLVVQEIRDNVTIDFEEFEMLYLTVRVRDLNTVIGDDYDEATFTITIIDMNDNAPIFANGTLTQTMRVRELAASGTLIGSVLATDIDGPLYNQVRYTIQPRNNTPEGLVKIDFTTGQIEVDANEAIDADEPWRFYLYYTVIASDECSLENRTECPPDPNYFEVPGDIEIEIIDTNNKVPEPLTEKFNTTVYVWENATSGDEVVQLYSHDRDRDELYHTVRYTINFAVNPRLRDFFEVDLDTGRLEVHYPGDEKLDRDGDEPTHTIFVNFIDNFFSDGDGRRNQDEVEIFVVLLDVNDNAPEMPSPDELRFDVSEGAVAGVRVLPEIYAPDRDEPDTDNSRVGYGILDLTITDRNIEVPDLFTMISIENKTGELETAMDLRGYWGTYEIFIEAFDHGYPQQRSNETYTLVIRPYNFHHPVFVFPQPDSVIRLSRERATEGGVLATAANEFLEPIYATDEDGLHAGSVTFHVQGNEEAVQYFDITEVGAGENSGQLILRQLFPEQIRQFRITIRATDGGTEPGPLWTDVTFSVVFVPTQGDPVFSENAATVAFFEGEEGLRESFELPQAEDLKNHLCEDDCQDIYYRFIDGNNEGLFVLDQSRNVISLAQELDREVATSYTLHIAASNSPDATGIPLQTSILVVTINVREANPRPIFEQDLYTAGISTLDSIGRELLTVRASHTEDDIITYIIDRASMQLDSSLEAVRDSAFTLHATTGVLSLNMQPTASMHGMFEFDVIATDTASAIDTARVKVYLISSQNRVTFIFDNQLETVEQNRNFIAATFSTGFNMTCNIDQVVPFSDSSGVAQDDTTEVRAHFIRDNVPVQAQEVEAVRSDTVLLRTIQLMLSTNSLVLQDLVTGDTPTLGEESMQIAVYALAALSAVLGFLCLVLLLALFCRTRALNRQLQALSMTKYGSVDSGLNRAGLAPGTNKHAVEGSNPMWNEAIRAPDFDAISDASGDSDLIGIEDMPQFRDDYFPPGDTDSSSGIVLHMGEATDNKPVTTHGNNFGFKSTPYLPQPHPK